MEKRISKIKSDSEKELDRREIRALIGDLADIVLDIHKIFNEKPIEIKQVKQTPKPRTRAKVKSL